MKSEAGKGGRVLLLTYGTRGDVEPFVALGAGLQKAGLAVRLAAPGAFEPLARAHRVAFSPLPGNPAELARDLVAQAGTSWPRMVRAMSRFVAPLGAQVSRQAAEYARDADLIVHTFLMTQTGHELARRRGIRSISGQLFPVFAPTSSFPAVIVPDLRGCGPYRRLTHWMVTQVFWQGSRILYRGVRKREPSLPPLGEWAFSGPRVNRPWILFAFSRHVVAPPPDWEGVAEVTGYWTLGAAAGWKPPIELERFLDAGPAPVYIGLGSAGEAAGGGWIRAALEALAACGLRGILDPGSGPCADDGLPDSVCVMRDVPHAWLLPRVAAVVHHGGAGTTGAGLAAGKPSVVVPTTADQPFWGHRVHALGVGPRPIRLRRLTAKNMAQALSTATANEAMIANAAGLGGRIRSEDGVGAAVDRITRMLGSP